MRPLCAPKCDEVKEFSAGMLRGETRGALGYVLPLVNECLEVPDYSREERKLDVQKFVVH